MEYRVVPILWYLTLGVPGFANVGRSDYTLNTTDNVFALGPLNSDYVCSPSNSASLVLNIDENVSDSFGDNVVLT